MILLVQDAKVTIDYLLIALVKQDIMRVQVMSVSSVQLSVLVVQAIQAAKVVSMNTM